MQIPEKLKERLDRLGLSWDIYDMRSRKCILSRTPLPLEKVPWYGHAYFIDEMPEKKDMFVFDPVSLVPCLALDPKKDDKILDMCAAPGTKTFILSFLTNNEAHIVSNDINVYRVRRLKSIVDKFSLSAEVTNISGRMITGSFNKILVDAPCSGEGMTNKKEKVFGHWSERRIKIFSKKQKKLIGNAFKLLETGGLLVYSTCTLAPEENEEVVDFLLKNNENAKIEEIKLDINSSHGLTEWNGKQYDPNLGNCLRIYPHHNNTSGFFVAKIAKN